MSRRPFTHQGNGAVIVRCVTLDGISAGARVTVPVH
jgi:hypothetical protein